MAFYGKDDNIVRSGQGRFCQAFAHQGRPFCNQKFIKQHTKEWTPDMVSDPVQDALLDIIAKKKNFDRKIRRLY